MDIKTLEGLNLGDLVKCRTDARVFVVTGNYGGHITVATTVDINNSSEWDLAWRSRGCQVTDCKFYHNVHCTFEGYCPRR